MLPLQAPGAAVPRGGGGGGGGGAPPGGGGGGAPLGGGGGAPALGGGGGGGRPEAPPTLGDTAGLACLTVAGAIFVLGPAVSLATVGGTSPAFFSLTLRIMDGSKAGSGSGKG